MLVKSEVSCSGSTLTITNEPQISSADLQNCQNSDTLIATSEGDITFPTEAFKEITTLRKISVKAKNIAFDQRSFQKVSNIELIEIEATQTIILGVHSFMHSAINEVILNATQDINIEQQAMQNVDNFNQLTVQTKGNFEAKIHSFINSMIIIEAEGNAIFDDKCFQNTPNLENFTVVSGGQITFQKQAFINSNVGEIDLHTHDSVSFEQQAFKNCRQLNNVSVYGATEIFFGKDSFQNSQAQGIYIVSEDQETSSKVLSKQGTVTFDQGSFQNCDELRSIDTNTNGNVDIKTNSFEDSKSLHYLNIHADGKATVQSNAFKGCKQLKSRNIDAKDVDIADDAFDSGKKHGSSSHKDDDSEDEKSAKTLGDFKIDSVYLGTSPNIFVNLNFFVSFMKKIRKTFGHIIPSPELIHSAIWVGQKDANDDTVGAIFVYGKYWNKHNLPSYIGRNGAKAYVMALGEFKEHYPAINPMKLNPHKSVNLFDFINKVKNSGRWSANDYNWPTNNCQHFTAKLIGILKATRDQPKSDDWVHLPKPVINSLKLNEDFLDKKN